MDPRPPTQVCGARSADGKAVRPGSALWATPTRLHPTKRGLAWCFAAAVDEQGGLWTWGSGARGQLGAGRLELWREKPQLVSSLTSAGMRVAAVACGTEHCLAISTCGALLAWGSNARGQLGMGSGVRDTWQPAVATALSGVRIVSIGAGDAHSLAADAAGRLFAWGCAQHGQLGLRIARDGSGSTIVPLPAQVPLPPAGDPVQQVAAGWAHSAVVTRSGAVYVAGSGLYRQLGASDTAASSDAAGPSVSVGTESQRQFTRVVALDCVGGMHPGTGRWRGVRHVACGARHTAAVDWIGDVYTWGTGRAGELGHDATPLSLLSAKRVTDGTAGARQDAVQCEAEPRLVECLSDKAVAWVACGASFTMCVSETGDTFCFGILPDVV